MGLDMYLYGIKCKVEGEYGEKLKGTWVELCYWRKANQIHNWFSENFIVKGHPWGYYEINKYYLEKLQLLCRIVLDNKNTPEIAEAILPPNGMGCCFGSTEINEEYYADVEYTYNQLKKILDKDYDTFFYMASW